MDIKIDRLQSRYGLKQVTAPVKTIRRSKKKNKKYEVTFLDGTKLDFGDTRYQHYKDRTKYKYYKKDDHLNLDRRKSYLARASQIKDKNGNLTRNNPKSPNFYSLRLLW